MMDTILSEAFDFSIMIKSKSQNPDSSEKVGSAKSPDKAVSKKQNDLKKLLEKNNLRLWDACELGNLEDLKDLLNKSSKDPLNFPLEINARLLDNWTALHLASNEGHSQIISKLIEAGADIESLTTIKRTPLHIAAFRGAIDVVKVLVLNNANVNAQDYEENTPLHMASERGHGETVHFLLKNKANPKKKNIHKNTAIDLSLNEETRRIYDEFLKDGEEFEVNDFVDGRLIGGRTNHIMKFLSYAGKAPMNASDEKRKGRESMYENEKEMDFARSASSTQGSKIMRIAMDHVDKTEKESKKIWLSNFDMLKELGRGGFGDVHLVRKKSDQKLYAMKTLIKEKLKNSNLVKYAHSERNILSIMDHPFIVKLNFAFQSEDKLYMVMDYCPGGDLSHYLDKVQKVNEATARVWVSEILLALEALHQNFIIFRDLKPDNVVLDKDGHALLTDFGLSKEGMRPYGQLSDSFCGSVAYIAPEILVRKGHNRMVDWYLLGVFMYELLVGLPPFFNSDRNILFQNVVQGILRYPIWEISPEAKDLIEKLLCRDPNKRLGYYHDGEDIKKHPWFNDINWDDVYNRKLKPPPIKIQEFPVDPMENSRFLKEKQINDNFDSHKFLNWTFIGEEIQMN